MILRPSNARRWVPCPGSLSMEDHFPEESNVFDQEGQAAHEAAHIFVNGHGLSVGLPAENGTIITDEMVPAAQLYAATVREQEYNSEQSETELHGDLGWGIAISGTPDFWGYNETTDTLRIVDFKYGHGVVDVPENLQLIIYARLIRKALATVGPAVSEITKIEFVIVQPRASHANGPVRTWKTTFHRLEPFFLAIRLSAKAALEPGARTFAGPHCRYCTARRGCDTLQNAAMEAVDYSGTSTPRELNPADMAVEYRFLQAAKSVLDSRFTAMETQMLEVLKRGEPIPGFMAKPGRGVLGWDKPVPEVAALGSLLGVELQKPIAVITPTQAKSKGFNHSLFPGYTKQFPGALKIVPDDRDALAKQIFEGAE